MTLRISCNYLIIILFSRIFQDQDYLIYYEVKIPYICIYIFSLLFFYFFPAELKHSRIRKKKKNKNLSSLSIWNLTRQHSSFSSFVPCRIPFCYSFECTPICECIFGDWPPYLCGAGWMTQTRDLSPRMHSMLAPAHCLLACFQPPNFQTLPASPLLSTHFFIDYSGCSYHN